MSMGIGNLAPPSATSDYSETMVAAWPLIGRAEELDRLRESTTPAAHGSVLSGPAGVGKTRLAREVTRFGWEPCLRCRVGRGPSRLGAGMRNRAAEQR